MSIDRLQSRQGVFVINPEPGFTVASSLSSIQSNQLPGGLILGSNLSILPAITGSFGGGALVHRPSAPVTFAASSGTGAAIPHDGNGVVFIQASSAMSANLLPPLYHGQMLTVVNISTVSANISTGAVISGQGAGSTTTAAVPTLTASVSIGANAARAFIGVSNYGTTATNSTTCLWQLLA